MAQLGKPAYLGRMPAIGAFDQTTLSSDVDRLRQFDVARQIEAMRAQYMASRGLTPEGSAREPGVYPYEPTMRDNISTSLMDLGMSPEWAGSLTGSEGAGRNAMVSPLDMVPAVGQYVAAQEADNPLDFAMATMPGAKGLPKSLNPGRISTRLPIAAKSTENPFLGDLTIGQREFMASPGFEHNASLLPKYPGFGRLAGMPADEATDAYIRQSADNLLFVHDAIPENIRPRSKLWYVGANKIANRWGSEYGLPTESVAGAMAALSPQKDWFQNVSLARRVIETKLSQANVPMTREMFAKQATIKSLNTEANLPIFARIRGKSLSDLTDPVDQALWIRLYDEAHNPRTHELILPEGDIGNLAKGKTGKPKKVGWGSLGEIAKAVGSIDSGGNYETISRLMGGKHKVRSFYNNIINPNEASFGDVTGDTHAVAANQLRPLSGQSTEVHHNFGTSPEKAKRAPGFVGTRGSSIDAAYGTYGANAEAYRVAAKERGILPREMQSITWEGVRGLFPEEFKNATNAAKTDAIWRAYDAGEISIDKARKAVVELSGGFRPPDWVGPHP
jgi:hypothetical protein